MNNISFIVFTFNEEKRISYVIQNFIKYGDVIILDDGSTDKTKEISEKLGAQYFVRPKTGKAYVENQEIFEFVKSKVKTDYIYWGFADNIAPKTLVEKFVEVANENIYKMIRVPLYTYLWGETKKPSLKTHTPFVFHKDFVDFTNNPIHGMGKFLGDKRQLLSLPDKKECAMCHFSTYNTNKFIPAHLRYAEAEALNLFKSKKRFSMAKMFLDMIKYCFFWGGVTRRRGSLSNIVFLNYTFFRFMVHAKLFELENGITIDSIEENYSRAKETILEKQ